MTSKRPLLPSIIVTDTECNSDRVMFKQESHYNDGIEPEFHLADYTNAKCCCFRPDFGLSTLPSMLMFLRRKRKHGISTFCAAALVARCRDRRRVLK